MRFSEMMELFNEVLEGKVIRQLQDDFDLKRKTSNISTLVPLLMHNYDLLTSILWNLRFAGYIDFPDSLIENEWELMYGEVQLGVNFETLEKPAICELSYRDRSVCEALVISKSIDEKDGLLSIINKNLDVNGEIDLFELSSHFEDDDFVDVLEDIILLDGIVFLVVFDENNAPIITKDAAYYLNDVKLA